MSQNKQFLLVIFILFILSGILYWVIWGNRSELIVQEEVPFQISVENFRRYDCRENPCHMKIPRGKKKICIKKTGYYPLCKNFLLPWRKITSWIPNLKRIPRIIGDKGEIDIEPKGKQEESLSSYHENTQEKKYSFSNETGELFFISEQGEKQHITRFFGIQNPNMIPYKKNLFLYTDTEVFYIETEKRKKTRIFTGTDITLQSYPFDLAIISADDKLMKFNNQSKTFALLPFSASLRHIASCGKNTIFYASQEENILSFYQYHLHSEKGTKITSAKGATNFTLECGSSDHEIRLIYENQDNKIIQF